MGYVADKQRVIVAVPPGVGFVRSSMLALVLLFETPPLTSWDTHTRENTLDLQAL